MVSNNIFGVKSLQEAEGACLGLQWGKRTISSQTEALHLWCGGSCLKLSTRGYHCVASCCWRIWALSCLKSATEKWAPRCRLLCSLTDVPRSANQCRLKRIQTQLNIIVTCVNAWNRFCTKLPYCACAVGLAKIGLMETSPGMLTKTDSFSRVTASVTLLSKSDGRDVIMLLLPLTVVVLGKSRTQFSCLYKTLTWSVVCFIITSRQWNLWILNRGKFTKRVFFKVFYLRSWIKLLTRVRASEGKSSPLRVLYSITTSVRHWGSQGPKSVFDDLLAFLCLGVRVPVGTIRFSFTKSHKVLMLTNIMSCGEN